MSIKYGAFLFVLLFLSFSCSKKEKFPPLKTEKLPLENVVVKEPFLSRGNNQAIDSIQNEIYSKELDGIHLFKKYYDERDEQFELSLMESQWNAFREQIGGDFLNSENLIKWIKINGFLLELTGDEKYAKELERVVISGFSNTLELNRAEIEKAIIPYIFTKDVDHIHINQFANATVEYEHSFFGTIKITQETAYPKSGHVRIHFSLKEKKYVELFVRIPEWASGATVNALNVKYVAPPGDYCKIAKQWKEGDWVEVELPINKIPD